MDHSRNLGKKINLLPKTFRQWCENRILSVQRTKFGLLLKTFLELHGSFFQLLSKSFFYRFVRTGIYVTGGAIWCKTTSKTILWIFSQKPLTLSQKFRQGCENCFLPVQRNKRTKNFERIPQLWAKPFLTPVKIFRKDFQNCILRVPTKISGIFSEKKSF